MSDEAAPLDVSHAASLLSPGWWARALTRQERRAGERAGRPAWAEIVEQAVAAAAPAQAVPPPDDRQAVLAQELRPFLAGVRQQLADGARSRLPSDHADPKKVADTYTAAVGGQLAYIASRTLNFELDRATAAGDEHFIACLATPAGLAWLFTEYPVLARLLGVASQLSTEAGLELLTRFAADRAAIVDELLGGTDPGPTVAVRPGLGDQHRGGRSVTAVSFADGRMVIYKPRSLATLGVFGQVIDWINERVPEASLRIPAAVSRPGYGWVEFIEHRPLPEADSAAEFYRREGILLAALYATHACDMHGENLIASAAVPVLVDVETIFHPELPIQRTTADDPAAEALAASVARAALLPYVFVGEDGVSDLSGMGGYQSPDAGNRPRFGGAAIEPTEHEAAILEGFRAGYDAIVTDRAAFISLIETCGDLEVRTIVRPTSGYARLIDSSTHPTLLRDAADREDALDVLRVASAQHPLLHELAGHELADLWNGDIPLLTSRPSAPDIWTSAERRLPGVLDRSGLNRALDKVTAMSEVDRRDQEWVISASLATRRPDPGHHGSTAGRGPGPLTAVAAEPGRLLAAACGLGDEIVARAIAASDGASRSRVNWLGLQLVEDTQWMLLPMGAALADGYLGVALFLAQLGELTGISRYADVSRRAASAVPEILDALDGRPELVRAVGCGGLRGLGGISYGLARIGRLLGDDELSSWGAAAAELAVRVDPAASPWWAAGSAGCLAAIAAAQAEAGSSMIGSDLAIQCADRLSELVEQTNGRCVPADDTAPVPAGFAAGPAGVGWALTRFAAVCAVPRYLAAGHRAARYAVEAGGSADSPGWCAGLAGLLLGLTCLSAEAGRLEAAGLALAERPVLGDLSLCHGELGIAEALTVVAAITGSSAVRHAQRQRAGLILDMISRYEAYCGTPGGIATPGLLSGLAGIGYGLLRLGFAERVPSVLLLEPASSIQ